MIDQHPYIYILRQELPCWKCGRFFVSDDPEWYDTEAMAPFLAAEERIKEILGEKNSLLIGPYSQMDDSIIHDMLVVSHEPEFIGSRLPFVDGLTVRAADGELFETQDKVYYATTRSLFEVRGEVAVHLFRDRHSEEIGCFQVAFNDALQKFLTFNLKWRHEHIDGLMQNLVDIPPEELNFSELISAVHGKWSTLPIGKI